MERLKDSYILSVLDDLTSRLNEKSNNTFFLKVYYISKKGIVSPKDYERNPCFNLKKIKELGFRNVEAFATVVAEFYINLDGKDNDIPFLTFRNGIKKSQILPGDGIPNRIVALFDFSLLEDKDISNEKLLVSFINRIENILLRALGISLE